ncbi:MAG: ACT domain-containing protein [Clostridia bacterium]|nr:ACT domain-containing protein [Clostridia bacterium]
MRAVVTVIGKDKVGIISKVSEALAENNVNILDITQTIMKDIFTMVMMIDITESKIKFTDLVDKLSAVGDEIGLEIRCQHEEIFNSMHKI